VSTGIQAASNVRVGPAVNNSQVRTDVAAAPTVLTVLPASASPVRPQATHGTQATVDGVTTFRLPRTPLSLAPTASQKSLINILVATLMNLFHVPMEQYHQAALSRKHELEMKSLSVEMLRTDATIETINLVDADPSTTSSAISSLVTKAMKKREDAFNNKIKQLENQLATVKKQQGGASSASLKKKNNSKSSAQQQPHNNNRSTVRWTDNTATTNAMSNNNIINNNNSTAHNRQHSNQSTPSNRSQRKTQNRNRNSNQNRNQNQPQSSAIHPAVSPGASGSAILPAGILKRSASGQTLNAKRTKTSLPK
jgi:hypothetical protein